MWEKTKRKSYMKKYHKEYKHEKKKLGIWERNRGNRIAQRKRWNLKNPEKAQVYNKVNWALRTGKLKRPNKCSLCNNKGLIMAHHNDYKKPLDIIWVCWVCHNKIHGDR